jgi:hypothetical protein
MVVTEGDRVPGADDGLGRIVFADRDRHGDPLDPLLADRTDPRAVGERGRAGFGDDAADVVGPRCLFHAGRDIDGVAIDADRAPGVALLADDDVAAVNADAKGGRRAERALVGRALFGDGLNIASTARRIASHLNASAQSQIAISPSPL